MTHTYTRYYHSVRSLALLLLCSFSALAQSDKAKKPEPPVYTTKEGKLQYTPDEKGNRIPDFSYAGYKAGDEAIPHVPVKVSVPFRAGDATLRIQSAIDYVASLPMDKNGFRGAVLLERGVFEVQGALRIAASGVVLRGSGVNDKGTVILGAGINRETLIRIAGKNDKVLSAETKISSAYVPVNALKISVANAGSFKAGDQIQIRRPSTQAWIDLLGTDHFGGGETALGWKPGQRDIFWDRKVTSVSGSSITLDAPLSTALDAAFGGGTVSKYTWNGRISNIGIENLELRSTYDEKNPKDEDHRWMAINFENAADGWVRQVNFKHFAGSAVYVQATAKRITVEDCKSLSPVSEIGGQRRYTFYTNGQQTLFQRLYSENEYHDFAVGFCAAGPNAFVQCESHLPYSFSGTIDSWASGVLFDIVNVDGQALSYLNRAQDGQGAGWSAANSVFWQCSASRVDNYAPPGAQNWAFGTWAHCAGNGYWAMSNDHVQPTSLYYAQLKDRLGDKVNPRIRLVNIGSEASSSPKVEVAMALTAQAVKPAAQLTELIDAASSIEPISLDAKGIKTIDKIGLRKPLISLKTEEVRIQNGVLVKGNTLMSGRRSNVQWWNGSSRPYALAKMKPHVTRFVPGQTGTGLTDDLNAVTDTMKQENVVALDHNYGLWYDRRRDDHERIRRMDGEVWPPFYELPFARSGQGTAWDGLSKYDLTKYNSWYWNRLKQFATLADQKGLVLIHENYFQHNIIEAGAHYADFPWRPANNINNTGFPEPVPYAGDKRIFLADQFYDINHPVRRELHKAYIKKCLDNFSGNHSVIQMISAEYTGPLHFVQFWLDTIKEWEKETGKNAIIGLSTTKDVQDAILADEKRASVVDLIDIEYWHYQTDGTAYEPKGGLNLAPRQHARLLKPKASSFEQIYRAVSEYRLKYPQKAVTYAGSNSDGNGWAVFMAGGSLPSIPLTPSEFLRDAASMSIKSLAGNPAGQWALAKEGQSYIVYNASANAAQLDLSSSKGSFKVQHINPKDGSLLKTTEVVKAGNIISLKKSSSGPEVLWITKI